MRASVRILHITLLCVLVSSCASLQSRLADSAAQKAIAQSETVLPGMPSECYVATAHAPVTIGEDAPVAIRAERQRTDWANASKRRCVAFYDALRSAHGRPH